MRYLAVVRLALCAITVAPISAMSAETAGIVGGYHEATCPSVDATRMPRVPRSQIASLGLVPAADCHPHAPVRYLGILRSVGSGSSSASSGSAVQVSGYTRADGTYVSSHSRAAPR